MMRWNRAQTLGPDAGTHDSAFGRSPAIDKGDGTARRSTRLLSAAEGRDSGLRRPGATCPYSFEPYTSRSASPGSHGPHTAAYAGVTWGISSSCSMQAPSEAHDQPGGSSCAGGRSAERADRSEERRVGKECRSRWWQASEAE